MSVKHVVGSDGLKEACEAGKPVVVKFYATWCGSCKQVAPKYERYAEENKDAGVQFVEMDYDEDEPFIANVLKVDLLPTFIAFKGPKILHKSPGSDEEGLKKVIAAAKEATGAPAAEQAAPAQQAAETPKTEEKKEESSAAAPAAAASEKSEASSASPFVKHVVGSDGLKEACEAGKPVVVKFYATWCGSCKQVAPKYARYAEENKDAGVQFVEMDYDEDEPFIANVLKVDLLPTFIAFKGPKILHKSPGSDEEGLKKVIAAAKEATA